MAMGAARPRRRSRGAVPARCVPDGGAAFCRIRVNYSPLPASGRAIAYDQLQPCVDTVVASHDLSAGRPCERRDPSPLASNWKKDLCLRAETRVRTVWVPAFAGTTP